MMGEIEQVEVYFSGDLIELKDFNRKAPANKYKKKKSKSDAASRTGKIRLLKKISVETIRLSASV